MHRLIRWLWTDRAVGARVARAALVPAALLLWGATWARARAYRHGMLRVRTPCLPTVAVGSLAVGGAGKTPIAAWVAGFYAARGVRPGVVLRPYGGGDEVGVHERLTPAAVVVAATDRLAGIARAAARGARVAVLDDALQRLDVARDVNVAVVSAEAAHAVPWTLPAGPWRERWSALRRADVVVITRKQAQRAAVRRVAARVRQAAPGRPIVTARLRLAAFVGLRSGRRQAAATLRGRRVVVACGIADPGSFATQCRGLGLRVARLVAWGDHHAIGEADVTHVLQAAAVADYVVVTEKDAAKLRSRWPAGRPEPLVAALEVVWEDGEVELRKLLATCSPPTAVRHPAPPRRFPEGERLTADPAG